MREVSDYRGRMASVAEAAAVLKVSEETIRRWAREGKLPAIRASKRIVRIDLDAYLHGDEWKDAREGKP